MKKSTFTLTPSVDEIGWKKRYLARLLFYNLSLILDRHRFEVAPDAYADVHSAILFDVVVYNKNKNLTPAVVIEFEIEAYNDALYHKFLALKITNPLTEIFVFNLITGIWNKAIVESDELKLIPVKNLLNVSLEGLFSPLYTRKYFSLVSHF